MIPWVVARELRAVGDDASLLTIAGLNLANTAVMGVIGRGFRSLDSVEHAGMRNATMWQRLGPEHERVVRGERGAV